MSNLERHDVPRDVKTGTDGWTLDVYGHVDRPISLEESDLGSLPVETFTDDFTCVEGWTAEDLTWRGIRVGTILDRAGTKGESSYGIVRALDGTYACSFPLNRLVDSVLAVELDGKPLPQEHGGPARLIPTDSGSDCWESIKWVSEIEITTDTTAADDTAKEIALQRID